MLIFILGILLVLLLFNYMPRSYREGVTTQDYDEASCQSIAKQNQNNIAMVGRWNLDYDVAIQNRKVYWANMDNCGCCCEQKNTTVKAVQHSDSDDEYIVPYVM